MQTLPSPLAPLSARRQFVCWFASPIEGKPGKFNKFPCRWDTGEVIDAQDPKNWTDFATAAANAARWNRGHGGGVGFVFTDADPYFFLDIDGCLLPAHPDGSPPDWSPLAKELLARLPGACVEVSHSGRALHVFGRYTAVPEHAKKNQPLGLELYTSGRFVALTGTHASGSVEQDCTASLALIVAQFFAPSPTGTFAAWTSEPVEGWSGPADDDELIALAIRSGLKSAAAAFGDGDAVTFKALWEGDATILGKRWPSDKGAAFDASSADQTLANHLAFWTGKDCERIERLMRASALVRPKWDYHRSYLGQTILKACAFVGNVASGVKRDGELVLPPPPADMEALASNAGDAGRALRDGAEYMGPLEQVAHFRDLFFMINEAAIYDLRRNAIMKKAAFDVVYGGHLFVIDPMGQKSTASAWDAYTLSRVHKPVIVDDLCFRPELPSGSIVQEGGKTFVNSYVPYDCPSRPGDVEPFLDLLKRQFSVEQDRAILLNYMASFAQNPGVKFQWWPVLQGTKGNGKTALMSVMRFIAGEPYSHLPNAHAMARDGMKFNSWVHRKLFIGVEEIDLKNRRDFLDEFKIIVTNERIPLEGKGTNQVTGDNRANGMLGTNFKAGVPVDADERRYAILYMAQQSAADLIRDGMGGEYWPNWWKWFRAGGAAHIAHYLKTFPLVAELDPANLAHRAPHTSSFAAAVEMSLGRAEQEVLNAIGEGLPGFAGGWVSSFYLDQLLGRIRANIPRNQRRDIMRMLGYDHHPALAGGRTNSVVMPDGVKPVLYLKDGHLALNLTSPADVAAAYAKAQQPGAVDEPAAVVVQAFR